MKLWVLKFSSCRCYLSRVVWLRVCDKTYFENCIVKFHTSFFIQKAKVTMKLP